MKYISLMLDDTMSDEMEKFIPELQSFIKASGFIHNLSYVDNMNDHFVNIHVYDTYEPSLIKKLKEHCNELGWKKPYDISKSSKNYIQAYMKAEKMLSDLEAKAESTGITTDNEDTDMTDLESFMYYLKDELMKLAIREYDHFTGDEPKKIKL